MEEIGRLLRETREKLGLTHQEIERATRIRVRYIEAMEQGDFSSLPSVVQARGFLRNYADYLGLNPDKVLRQYAGGPARDQDHPKGPDHAVEHDQPRGVVEVQPPRWITTDLLVAMGIILAVLVVLVWGGSRLILAMQEQAGQSTEEVSGLNLLSTSSATATATATPASADIGEVPQTAAPAAATLPEALTGGGGNETGISLRLLIERRAFLEVFVDGEEAFRGRAAPGEILEYGGEQLIRLVTGNGGGVRAVFNGQDQGRLGDVGEAVIRLWDLNGVITPTPTPSATATATEEVTATATTTVTPLP